MFLVTFNAGAVRRSFERRALQLVRVALNTMQDIGHRLFLDVGVPHDAMPSKAMWYGVGSPCG